ncbi:G-protein coupled receptor family C group 6 member A-like [Gigantopelta aegis]|uniref:G-protein coupled receptor family C group 6 member A-like n=1 Tax=Gigantopelta aegis TaxID=1735272 RepID=UPI001B8898B4|nr:G-protein coupled receptor family C group 6 member A-like [Gigantopelta aegis]
MIEFVLQAAIAVAGLLDWTYVSALGLKQQIGRSDLETFVNMTKEGSLCIASTHELDTDHLSSSGFPDFKSKAALLFTGDSLIRSVPETSSTLLVVSTEMPLLQKQSDDVIFLVENTPRLEGLTEYLYQLVNTNISLNVQRGYLLTDSECFRDMGVNNSEIHLKCLRMMKTNYEHLAMADATFLLLRVAKERIQANCSGDVAGCTKTSLTFINDVMSFFTYNGRRIAQRRPTFRLIFPRSSANQTETIDMGNIETPVTIPTAFYNSHCGDACFECTVCRPSFSSDERVMFNDADLLLVGVFPIHTSTPGRKCAVPNVGGFKIAQAFTNAIQMLSQKNLTLPNNISFGGVVFDSCGDQTWFSTKHHEIENCLYHYKNSDDRAVVIQPSKTVAYFNTDAFSGFNTVSNTAKLSMTIADTGITFGNSTNDHYTDSVIRTLKEIKWTYIYFIVSDTEFLKNKADQFKMKSSEHGICIGGVITLKHNASGHLLEESMSTLNEAKEDAGTFLLLTTEHDTMQMFTNLLNKPVPKLGLKVLIFSWHLRILQTNNLENIIDEAVVIWPRPATSAGSGVPSSGNPWYEQFQNPQTNNGSTVDILQLLDSRLTLVMNKAVESLVSSLAIIYKNRCPRQGRMCKAFTDFESLKDEVRPLMLSGIKDLQDTFYINRIDFKDGELVVQKVKLA